jgi:hypothetical protein
MTSHAGREFRSHIQNEKQPAISKNAAAMKNAIDFTLPPLSSLRAAQLFSESLESRDIP